MDEYGTCRLDDAPMLAEKIKVGESVIFGFTIGDGSAYVISITPQLRTIGKLPFGGIRARSYGVGVLYQGFFHFDLRAKPLFSNYVGEKLRLGDDDAQAVTEILNAIGKELHVA